MGHWEGLEKFDVGLATDAEKTRRIKLWIVSFMIKGRALQLVKAVEHSNGFDAWRRLNKALKPT